VTRRRSPLASLALVLLAVLAAALLGPAPAHAATPGPIQGGASQPVYSYADAIRETVWVDTGLDLDGLGHGDRVAADIIRPREPAAAGLKIPVIMDASPYFSCCGRGNENQVKTYDAQGRPVQFPLYYDNYFVPRGYAVALVAWPAPTARRAAWTSADSPTSPRPRRSSTG
jgi:X-Pro dipeptidyl-peptidase